MKLDDLIFHDDLEEELSLLLRKPEKIPAPLCFFGLPGNGKTSFAHFLANSVSNTVDYFDMNARKRNGASSGKVLDDIAHRASVGSVIDERSIWRRVIILDEWHDLTLNEQNAYKVPFEKFSENNMTLFILCVNTDRTNSIDKVLSSAIKSRCYSISFNTPKSVADEVTQKIATKYPELPVSLIEQKFPDMRQIAKLAAFHS